MVTCNKIPLAQHARREKRLKLNTVTLREALQAHTNSRADAPSSSLKDLVSQVRFNLEGCDIFYETEPCQQKQQKGVIKKADVSSSSPGSLSGQIRTFLNAT